VPESNDRPFQVDALPQVKERMYALAKLAPSADEVADYKLALTVILGILKRLPTAWGDPLFATKAFKGIVYRGLYFPLIVHYVVYAERQIVFIVRIDPDPSSYLGGSTS